MSSRLNWHKSWIYKWWTTGQLLIFIYVILAVFLLITLFFCVICVLIVKFLSLLYCCDSLVIWSRMRQKMLLLLVITSADAFLKCSCNGIKTTLRSGDLLINITLCYRLTNSRLRSANICLRWRFLPSSSLSFSISEASIPSYLDFQL